MREHAFDAGEGGEGHDGVVEDWEDAQDGQGYTDVGDDVGGCCRHFRDGNDGTFRTRRARLPVQLHWASMFGDIEESEIWLILSWCLATHESLSAAAKDQGRLCLAGTPP